MEPFLIDEASNISGTRVIVVGKESAAITISVVTKPFKFEGKNRIAIAEDGLEKLRNEIDSIIVIPNDKFFPLIDKKSGLKENFKIIDAVLEQAVSGILGVILASEESDININLDDLKTVMSHQGMSLIGVGEHKGENAAYKAIMAAVDNMSINGAMGILVHFKIHPDFSIMEISNAMDVIHESVHMDAEVIFGTSTDDSLLQEYVKTTVVATGFKLTDEFTT